MRDISIQLVETARELEQVFKIREMVFVNELNVAIARERDEFDASSSHVLVWYKEEPIGCARIRFIKRKAKLERVAVLKDWRKRGVGTRLMDFLIEHCSKNEVGEIILHAQCKSFGFYKKRGFVVRGEPFMEEGIKHVEMYREV